MCLILRFGLKCRPIIVNNRNGHVNCRLQSVKCSKVRIQGSDAYIENSTIFYPLSAVGLIIWSCSRLNMSGISDFVLKSLCLGCHRKPKVDLKQPKNRAT